MTAVDDLVGHQWALALLRRSLASGHLSHSYLFSGPRQVGKHTLARLLAQTLNCERGGWACGDCRPCRLIANSVHPDVRLVVRQPGSKNISIDDILELQHLAALSPHQARWKVFILRNAGDLSLDAANCLLKTLEEPPARVTLLLTAADASMLLPTLVSRCQHVRLRPVPPAVISDHLATRLGVPPDRAKVLARLSQGSPGWAIAAVSGDGPMKARKQRLEEMLALSTADRLARLAYARDLAELWSADRDALSEVLRWWQSWWHDLALVKSGVRAIINVDRQEEIDQESARYSPGAATRFLAVVHEVLAWLERNVNPRLALDVLTLELPRPLL